MVAWLHELLEHTSISEEALLAEGLSIDELRALRLLTRDQDSRSNTRYRAHVELLARARGAGAGVARECQARRPDRPSAPPCDRSGRVVTALRAALEILRDSDSPTLKDYVSGGSPLAIRSTPKTRNTVAVGAAHEVIDDRPGDGEAAGDHEHE